ncbi:MAG TPA: hypothetical protein VMM59_09190 [Thermohalobaculum sp.]|nr:hypothetical protein [Thermohalobaculum sp.]
MGPARNAARCGRFSPPKLAYAQPFQPGEADLFTPIGINRSLPIDEHRRGEMRFANSGAPPLYPPKSLIEKMQ